LPRLSYLSAVPRLDTLLVMIVLLLAAMDLKAQQNNIPYGRDVYVDVERTAAKLNSRSHTALKPVLESRMDLSDVKGYKLDTTKYYYWQAERLNRDHLLQVKGDDFMLAADVLLHLEVGQDFGDQTLYSDTVRYYHNMRGFRVKGDLGTKFSFETMFMENQGIVPQYIFRMASTAGVVSGAGRSKIDSWTKLDYGWSQGNISYSPASWMNIQFGHGRHFVGHGYRSVLLMDHAPSAPYLKFSFITRNRWLQYTTWHTKLQNGVMQDDRLPTGTPGESLFYWKRARFNHLSISIGRFDLGIFESTIFRNIDDEGVREFDVMELNPLIGVNSVMSYQNGDNGTTQGADLKIRVLQNAFVYGQVAISDLFTDRFAYQGGVRIFDILRRDINLQVEYNSADPQMYRAAHLDQSYIHSGLPLAHPFGINFTELVGILDIGYKRWRLQNKVIHATYHLPVENEPYVGSNILLGSDFTVERQLTHWDSNVSYLFNPKIDLRAQIGFMRRDLVGAVDGLQSSYAYVAVRTGLFNRYYDL
jgi:hypothetical protein